MKTVVENTDGASELPDHSTSISESVHPDSSDADKFMSCPFKNDTYEISNSHSLHGHVYIPARPQDGMNKRTTNITDSGSKINPTVISASSAESDVNNIPSSQISNCCVSNFESHAGPCDKEHQISDTTNFLICQDLGDEIANVTFKNKLPEYLQLLETGESLGDSNLTMDSIPDWVNMEKYRKGQKFATEYFFGIVFAEMLSLMLLFLYPENLKPLIYTGKSDTPYKAFKRYLSTVIRVRSWYESDMWRHNSEAHRNLRIVRDMHETYRRRINSLDAQEFDEKSTLKPPVWSELSDKLREDFRSACADQTVALCPYTSQKDFQYINQADMAGTQFGFVGLMILYPSAFGAGGASEEDLEGFVHLWRCIGYMLGIEDRYNFCAGDLATVRQRSRDILEYKMKPKLRSVDRDWEHMYRCVVKGISYYVPGVTFEISLLYLCRLLKIRSPNFESSLTYFQGFWYRFTCVVMCFLLRFPPYRAFSNWMLRTAIKKASAPSPEWVREHEEKVYPYQAQAKGSLFTQL